MLKNEYFGYILFSGLMGLLAYLMIPYDTFDLIRHYSDFNSMRGIDFHEILIVDSREKHYVFNVFLWIINILNLPKELVPFLVTFLKYFLYFVSFKYTYSYFSKTGKNSTNSAPKKYIFALFLFFLFNELRFIDDASGLRNSLAFALFILSIVLYSVKKKILFPILLTSLAIGIHFSIIPLALTFIFASVIKLGKVGKFLFIISLIMLVTGTTEKLFTIIMGALEPFLRSLGLYFHAYMDIDGVWGAAFYDDKNIKTIILNKVIKPLPFYLAGIYLLLNKQMAWKLLQNYLFILFIFIAIISISRTMLDRYSYFFAILFILVLTSEYCTKPLTQVKKIFLFIFFTVIILGDLAGIYKYRDLFIPSWSKVFYIPAPVLLLESVETNEYIHRHGH